MRVVEPLLEQINLEMATTVYSPELANALLNLPGVPEDFLAVKYLADDEQETTSGFRETLTPYPLAAGNIVELPIKDVIWLSAGDDIKEAIDISFNTAEKEFNFKPGDTVGIIPANSPVEVESILNCLGILESSHHPFKIHVKTETNKKNATMPLFIPEITNAQHVLENLLEIRAPLKKLFLRALVEYTTEPKEKRRMEELCSRQGAKEFAQLITEARASLLDILECFPSCRPPLSRLIEFLPRLSARPYSISSSPLNGPEFHFTLSLEKFPTAFSSQEKQGVCSGWLFQIAKEIAKGRSLDKPSLSLSQQFENVSLQDNKDVKRPVPVKLFLRKSTEFSLPDDQSVPLIFVGPGTGVAPFIGFLQHRALLRKNNPSLQFGETWLFFGCRYKERDFLYKDVIDCFLDSGVLSRLFVSFSRDAPGKVKYVQDNIKLHSKEFVDQLLNKNGVLFVCGEAAGMAKDVFQSIVAAIQAEKDITADEALQQVTDLKTSGRYLQDIWA